MCREMHPLLLLYTFFSCLKSEISDDCAIFKITLKNGHSKVTNQGVNCINNVSFLTDQPISRR